MATKKEEVIKRVNEAIKIVNEQKCLEKVCDNVNKFAKLDLVNLISFTIATKDTTSKDGKEKKKISFLMEIEKKRLSEMIGLKYNPKQPIEKILDAATNEWIKKAKV